MSCTSYVAAVLKIQYLCHKNCTDSAQAPVLELKLVYIYYQHGWFSICAICTVYVECTVLGSMCTGAGRAGHSPVSIRRGSPRASWTLLAPHQQHCGRYKFEGRAYCGQHNLDAAPFHCATPPRPPPRYPSMGQSDLPLQPHINLPLIAPDKQIIDLSIRKLRSCLSHMLMFDKTPLPPRLPESPL